MNLKNTITKTETLKNNIKTIFTQIKQSIVRGGGSDFKSLAETPKQIESMLREYNKSAVINIPEALPNQKTLDCYELPINVDFTATKAIVSIGYTCISSSGTNKNNSINVNFYGFGIDKKTQIGFSYGSRSYYYYWHIESITNNFIKLRLDNKMESGADKYLKDITIILLE